MYWKRLVSSVNSAGKIGYVYPIQKIALNFPKTLLTMQKNQLNMNQTPKCKIQNYETTRRKYWGNTLKH